MGVVERLSTASGSDAAVGRVVAVAVLDLRGLD
jgi:hypothetical protein